MEQCPLRINNNWNYQKLLITDLTTPLRVTQCILWVVHCLCHMCQRMLLVVLWLLIGTRLLLLTVELLSAIEPLCSSQCLFGMILVALYLMVWDWWGFEQSRYFPFGRICSFSLFFTILSFSSFHWLVVWGWSLRIDRVLTLSQPCTADSILIIIIKDE